MIQNHQSRIRISILMATACAVVGTLSIIGHIFSIEILVRPLVAYEAMNIFTALGFVLISITLIALGRRKSNKLFLWTLIGTVIGIALTRLCYSIGLIDNINWTYFESQFELTDEMRLKDMAENSMIGFLLCAIAVLASSYSGNLPRLVATLSTLLVIVLSLFSLIGYLYAVEEFKTSLENLPMPPQTAITFA